MHAAPGMTYAFTSGYRETTLDTVIRTAQKIAQDHRDRQASWDECKVALRNHYDVIFALDPRWKSDDETN